MILADEYEELEKEHEAFAQENKFSKTKSASLTQVTCRRCEETDNQETRGNDPWSPPHQARRQQATDAPRGGQWTTPPPATETAKQYIVEAAKQHTEATRCHPYHRPAGGLSKMWWERTVG